jgi:hypothetical protein
VDEEGVVPTSWDDQVFNRVWLLRRPNESSRLQFTELHPMVLAGDS